MHTRHGRLRAITPAKAGWTGTALLLLSVTAASAQSLPDGAIHDWTGFFAGVTAGAWIARGRFVDDEGAGLLGGVRTGYNHAFGPLVVGVEADIGAASIHQRVEAFDVFGETDIDWFATVRGRAGMTLPSIEVPVLVYGTGGLAVAGVTHTIGDTSTIPFAGLFGPNSEQSTRTGYTVGAGAEIAVTDRAVIGFEYLYTDLGQTTVNGICVVCFGGSTPGTPFAFDFDTKLHTIRANLTFKFGG
ncbi:MAG: outer membrane beta-barrel protein [Roseitalea porphyridii]|jgi:outer membrane immunogenic protein|uniref:outer membrane protein n=1 Tax=Roseitalea porphyridii TaxID=1852022 RepID=UPI0032EABF4D